MKKFNSPFATATVLAFISWDLAHYATLDASNFLSAWYGFASIICGIASAMIFIVAMIMKVDN